MATNLPGPSGDQPMSRNHPAALALVRKLCVLFLAALVLVSAPRLMAQCPSQDEAPDISEHPFPKFPDLKNPPPLEEPILPEAGFLSDTHYTSQFFGFSLDLPLTVKGHEIMTAVMPEREHALLSLQFEKGLQNGYITITAIDPKRGLDVKSPEYQVEQQLRIWAQNGGPAGVTPLFPIPEYMLHSGRWFYSVRHKGNIFAAQYWTAINNYVVKVVVGTNDHEFLSKAKKIMADAQFYCPQDDGTLMTQKGKPVKIEGEPYQGPTVPTFRVNKAIKEQPGKDISAGQVTGGTYRNADIGLQYTFPLAWQALPVNHNDSPGDPSREYQFLHACSQTLLRIVPQPAAGTSYRDGPMIVLRALDYNCLSMRTAVTLSDKRALDEVAATLETTGEFGQIDNDQMKMMSDRLFMVFHGMYSSDPRSEDLSQRMSQTIYATKFNKMLLVWSLMAPTKSELDQLPTGSIVLEGVRPIQLNQSLRAKNQP
jgi:hypothetical protein